MTATGGGRGGSGRVERSRAARDRSGGGVGYTGLLEVYAGMV